MDAIRMDASTFAAIYLKPHTFNCSDPSFPNMCVRYKNEVNFETMFLEAAGLGVVHLKPNDSRWEVPASGDAALKDVRLGNLDMTKASYVPRPDRIAALPVISTPLSYYTDGVLLNRQLSAKVEEVDWNRVFKPSLWIIVGLWRLTLLVVPELNRIPGGKRGPPSVVVLCEIFGFYFQLFFVESFLTAHVVRDQKPFSSIGEAVTAAKRQKYTMVFAYSLPGWSKLHRIETGEYEIVRSEPAVIAKVAKEKNYIALGDSGYFDRMYRSSSTAVKSNVYLYDFTPARFAVAFCRKRFERQREYVERAYQQANQAGLSYEYHGVGMNTIPPERGIVRAVSFGLLKDSFSKWIFFVASSLLILITENTLSRQRRFGFNLRLAESFIQSS